MLGVFFATIVLTVLLAIQIPKGFFPIQDTGLITGVSEASQDVSPEKMMRLQQDIGDIILRDPDVQALASQTGNTDNPTPPIPAASTIVLKPRDQRKATAPQVIDSAAAAVRAGSRASTLFMQAAQDINVGARLARGGFQYTLQAANIAELIEWSQKMLEKMRTLPETCRCVERSAGQCATAQDHHQPRPGIALRHFAATDRRHPVRRLRAASGHPILHPAQHQSVILEITARAAERPHVARPPLCQVAADRRRRAAVGPGGYRF